MRATKTRMMTMGGGGGDVEEEGGEDIEKEGDAKPKVASEIGSDAI